MSNTPESNTLDIKAPHDLLADIDKEFIDVIMFLKRNHPNSLYASLSMTLLASAESIVMRITADTALRCYLKGVRDGADIFLAEKLGVSLAKLNAFMGGKKV